jgi:hypothetical protein
MSGPQLQLQYICYNYIKSIIFFSICIIYDTFLKIIRQKQSSAVKKKNVLCKFSFKIVKSAFFGNSQISIVGRVLFC